MCRALKIACVASDAASLAELKSAASGAEWELTPGATSPGDALKQIADERPHVMVVAAFPEMIAHARELLPGICIVSTIPHPEANEVIDSLEGLGEAIRRSRSPKGPVRT